MITHKELMNEIQKMARLDRHQTSALLNSLEKILADEAIDQNSVQLDGLGTFISHKHPEYIQDNNQTGEAILYPPRITCRIDFKNAES